MTCSTYCIDILCSYAVITVMPTLTALTVQEADQMVEIVINVNTFFMGTAVPFTLTYVTTNVTAEGRLYIWVVIILWKIMVITIRVQININSSFDGLMFLQW